MSKKNAKVDFFFSKQGQWQEAYAKLRSIPLACGLTEELKWGKPCYTFDGNNILLIHGFKNYCAYLFPKGVLLKDPEGILVQQTKNVQSARQIRFTSVQEIEELAPVLTAYIEEAIAVEKAGLQVEFKQTDDFEMPEEFINKLEEVPGLQDAFVGEVADPPPA